MAFLSCPFPMSSYSELACSCSAGRVALHSLELPLPPTHVQPHLIAFLVTNRCLPELLMFSFYRKLVEERVAWPVT